MVNPVEHSVSDYETIGGAPAVRTVVDRFYERVVGDEQLAPYFASVDMLRLKRHQTLLLSQVLGGPADYDGRDLAVAHAGLDITDNDFGRVANHLAETLREAGVDDDLVGRVVGVLGGVKEQIVTGGADES
jgi:hemoglobin